MIRRKRRDPRLGLLLRVAPAAALLLAWGCAGGPRPADDPAPRRPGSPGGPESPESADDGREPGESSGDPARSSPRESTAAASGSAGREASEPALSGDGAAADDEDSRASDDDAPGSGDEPSIAAADPEDSAGGPPGGSDSSGGSDGAGAAASPSGRLVESFIRRLASGPPDDREAFRDLSRVSASLIPGLILEVENARPTRIFEFDVVALHGDIARRDEKDGAIYYFVKGMGSFSFDEVASGPVRGTKGATRLRFRNRETPFSVGVVLRAALINRFSSPTYPRRRDADDLRGWWREYYELSKDRL